MNDDDPIKKLLLNPIALSDFVNPLDESIRNLALADFRHLTGMDESTLRLYNLETDYATLLKSTRTLQIPQLDTSGLTSLLQDAQSHSKLLASVLDYSKHTDAFSYLTKELSLATSIYQDYTKQFRLPEFSEAARFAHESITAGLPALQLLGPGFEDSLKIAMGAMETPWLRTNSLAQSVGAFSELQAVGAAINLHTPYDDALSSVLRHTLGDWRAVTELPSTIFSNPVARSEFYVGLGFDASLTEFTAPAFDESMALAGFAPAEREEPRDGEDDGEARNVRAYRYFLELERKVREFIDRVMTEAFGPDWIKYQTNNMLGSWEGKRQAAIKGGEVEQPLIAYADFTDYIRIIERKDNWATVFKKFFGRTADIQESFLRLFTVRNGTMHSRFITLDDELLLRVECRRILRAIGGKH
jgi:hypothetical protein